MNVLDLVKSTATSAIASTNSIATQLMTDDGWKWRRLCLFATLTFFAGSIAFMEIRGTDNALYLQAVIAEIGSMTALVTGYVFGAIWDDKNKRMHAFGPGETLAFVAGEIAAPAKPADAPPAPAARP